MAATGSAAAAADVVGRRAFAARICATELLLSAMRLSVGSRGASVRHA